jgi:hypothetical protein
MSSTDRLFVATRKGLFELRRRPTGWRIERVSFLAETVTMMLADGRDGTLYAALRHGHFGVKFQRSDDDGESWQECATPAYPEKPASAENDPHPWTVDQLWALETGGADEPGALWAGTLPGGLFRTDDYGESWELVRSLWDRPERAEWMGGGYDVPGIHSICVDPRDSARLVVGVSCGGVWQTADRGTRWELTAKGMFAAYMPPERRDDEAIQDPHRMVCCPADPERFWVAHHNGVFQSRDGARTWTEVPNVEPSVFGFAAAVAPDDPDTAWFVPAVKDEHRLPVGGRFVVARTRDGGDSFEVLTGGLPQEHAYHLVYRHALDVAPEVGASGATLAMGSTTGGLWASENGGDHWQEISQHLPPVYAVRFG